MRALTTSGLISSASSTRKENVYVVGDKPVKNDAGEMSMSEKENQNTWAEHYERLLNVEFDWDPDHLPIIITIEGHLKDEVGQSFRSTRHSGYKEAGDTGATCSGLEIFS